MGPTLSDIVADTAIYRHFRRRGSDVVNGRVVGLGRMLWTGPWLGWMWFLGRGPWKVRPLWLRVVWWAVPLVVGIWMFRFSVMGWLSMYFWVPPIAGWIWEKRINAFVLRITEREQYAQVEQEIVEMQSTAPTHTPTVYDDPNRLKS